MIVNQLFQWTNDLDTLFAYLTSLDFFGFLVACYTTRIGEGFYAVIILAISIMLYNRFQSLPLCALLWILLGGLGFLVAAPTVSVVAVALTTFGVISLIYELVFGGLM